MDDRRFKTAAGMSIPAVTAAEMREIDRIAVEEVGLPLLSMMENAGRTLASQARNLLSTGAVDPPIVVFAGSGGNGGGGLCAARHLVNHGHPVRILLDRDSGQLAGHAATQFTPLEAMDVPVLDDAPTALNEGGLAVDAVIGYGLSGTPRGRAETLIESINDGECVLSLDVPSGMDATSGATPGAAVTPDRTVTLALPKTGLTTVPGDLYLADIGIPGTVYDRVGITVDSPFDGEYCIHLAR